MSLKDSLFSILQGSQEGRNRSGGGEHGRKEALGGGKDGQKAALGRGGGCRKAALAQIPAHGNLRILKGYLAVGDLLPRLHTRSVALALPAHHAKST